MKVKVKDWTAGEILALRTRLKLRQEDAAELVGVTKSAWCFWEKGRQVPARSLRILLELLEEGVLTARVERLYSS